MTTAINECIQYSKRQSDHIHDLSQVTDDSHKERLIDTPIENKTQFDFKQLSLLVILYSSVYGSVIMNSISLQNIGISNLVINSLVMTIADSISNLLVFLYFHKIKRKKNLLNLNYLLFLISACLFGISFSPNSVIKNIINLILSFILKLLLMLILILQLLFNGKIF